MRHYSCKVHAVVVGDPEFITVVHNLNVPKGLSLTYNQSLFTLMLEFGSLVGGYAANVRIDSGNKARVPRMFGKHKVVRVDVEYNPVGESFE